MKPLAVGTPKEGKKINHLVRTPTWFGCVIPPMPTMPKR